MQIAVTGDARTKTTVDALEIGQEVEGVKTVHELYAMARRLDVDMPITEQVYRVVYEGLPPARAVQLLLNREPKSES